MTNSNNPLEDILKTLPEAAKQLKQEASNVSRSILDAQLKKSDTISRTEFVEQQELLQAALEKLHLLEEKINALSNNQSS